MQQLMQDIGATLTTPFVGQLDLVHLFLLVGIVLVFAAAWVMVLHYVHMAASAVVET
jgi:hypothetical protein